MSEIEGSYENTGCKEILRNKRSAVDQQQAPTGEGEIIYKLVADKIHTMMVAATIKPGVSIISPVNLQRLWADLDARSEMGLKKYGTYLRGNNGRSARVDLYQEVCDAIMYSMQARQEGDREAGQYVEILLQIGSQLAGIVNKRG